MDLYDADLRSLIIHVRAEGRYPGLFGLDEFCEPLSHAFGCFQLAFPESMGADEDERLRHEIFLLLPTQLGRSYSACAPCHKQGGAETSGSRSPWVTAQECRARAPSACGAS